MLSEETKGILRQLRVIAAETTARARRRPTRKSVGEADRAVRAYRDALRMVERFELGEDGEP
jgi:hypothetical protein